MNLVITDRSRSAFAPSVYESSILFHPKSLVLGIGCDKDTPISTLRSGLSQVMKEFSLSEKSIAAIGTLDIKAKELGLQELARTLNCPLLSYTPAQLDGTKGVQNPSDTVKKYVGTDSVGEAAALKTAEVEGLLVEKQKYYDPDSGKNMTIAICRKEFQRRPS